jgi:hypothetical protein
MKGPMYYFISYVWRCLGDTNYQYGEELSDIHPVLWLLTTRKHPEEYKLLWWSEIPAEIFNEVDGRIG